MKTWTQLLWKTFSQLEPGEIARAKLGGNAALIIKLDDDAAGILECDGEQHRGIWFTPQMSLNCISFGSAWLLDVDPDGDLFPDNPAAYDAASSLFFDTSGFVFRFRSPPGKISDHLCYSITTMKITDGFEKGSAPINQWSIWESENHRLAAGTKPLIAYPTSG